jgi:hypothetical protein
VHRHIVVLCRAFWQVFCNRLVRPNSISVSQDASRAGGAQSLLEARLDLPDPLARDAILFAVSAT